MFAEVAEEKLVAGAFFAPPPHPPPILNRVKWTVLLLINFYPKKYLFRQKYIGLSEKQKG